ncbi:unnamed protein product [Citrullus colocynthis]|uniref:Uncharacterized protein n=1 Tax=Citrullus colocynthis TaxID=252529 RepID=A0ABP0YU36_9ROSI
MFRSICSLLFKKSTAGLLCSDSTVVQEIFHQLPDPPQLPDLLPLTRSSNSVCSSSFWLYLIIAKSVSRRVFIGKPLTSVVLRRQPRYRSTNARRSDQIHPCIDMSIYRSVDNPRADPLQLVHTDLRPQCRLKLSMLLSFSTSTIIVVYQYCRQFRFPFPLAIRNPQSPHLVHTGCESMDMDEILTFEVPDGFEILDGDALVILRTMSKGSTIGCLVG